ncbi:hypothetical protein BN940_04046 [Castellaniella defragrans 65Phen]|jgi:hypothetical protein|uniref:Uncharacterized protein n=1 Tax=Castellaniella defragrans (strain DSM 12143 / CCUG 39792 / 65Phen) TaxID=1437824 RepID=W8WUB9_CASD6|nr:hypothetical protein [Castellaniella defragrans]CDM23283.1 hypothetical protein BN940_04046 [Castellaniella defragrans 65Phen]
MTTALTDLEARLAAPGGAALRDALVARAAGMEAALRARMAAGLPRRDFPAWHDIAEAAAAAQAILAAWPANDAPSADPAGPEQPF